MHELFDENLDEPEEGSGKTKKIVLGKTKADTWEKRRTRGKSERMTTQRRFY